MNGYMKYINLFYPIKIIYNLSNKDNKYFLYKYFS